MFLQNKRIKHHDKIIKELEQEKAYYEKKTQEINGDHDTYFPMFQTAQALEKNNIDGAIDIYIDILRKFRPDGISYYERPAILLEKQKRFDEAIEICDTAFRNIDVFSKPTKKAIIQEIGKRRERLLKKMSSPK